MITLPDQVVYAPMLTYDGDIEATLFCLAMYARHWPECPLVFVVPVNSHESETLVKTRAPPNIKVQTTICKRDVDETLAALFAVCEAGGDWVFWCNSDRYPVAINGVASLNQLARWALDGHLSQGLAKDIQAVRMTRWLETLVKHEGETLICGQLFEQYPASMFGFYHHHLIRREYLRNLLSSVAGRGTLYGMHDRLVARSWTDEGLVLTPRRPLIKFEETTANGKQTLNFYARRVRAKEKGIDGDALAASIIFTSPQTPNRNMFWQKNGIPPTFVLAHEPSTPNHIVVSYGGVGSKQVWKWIYADDERFSDAHCHSRIPFTRIRPRQQILYVFGDPRNAALSVFERRKSRHERHGFSTPSDGSRSEAMPKFAMLHCSNVQADVGDMDETWGLETYLENGRDLFRLEEHFDCWMYADVDYEVLFVRYETFWRTASAIAEHLGLSDRRPPLYHPRRSDWRLEPPEIRSGLDNIYADFAARLDELPDVFTVRGKATKNLLTGEFFTPEHA